jgi:hypothetical protein
LRTREIFSQLFNPVANGVSPGHAVELHSALRPEKAEDFCSWFVPVKLVPRTSR